MLEILLNLFENYNQTCSITNLKDKCVSFIRSEKYYKYIEKFKNVDAWVIIPKDFQIPQNINLKLLKHDYPEYAFTLFHNEVYKNNNSSTFLYGENCNLNETALFDVEGLKVVNTPTNEKLQFIHTGGIIIGNNVNIGPYSVIHKGTMDNTIIGNGCHFGAYTNIGHNCIIGNNVVMAANVVLSGGVKVGDNCWFGSGSVIRHYINICDNVVIGTGTVVVKDINKSGIYVGNPARYLKPIEKGWNF